MEYYFFGGCLVLLAVTAGLALHKIAQISKTAIEAVKAQNLQELVEVEHERAKNQVDLQAIIDANKKAWEQKKNPRVTQEHIPADHEVVEFGSKIVTDTSGRKYHVDELEVL